MKTNPATKAKMISQEGPPRGGRLGPGGLDGRGGAADGAAALAGVWTPGAGFGASAGPAAGGFVPIG